MKFFGFICVLDSSPFYGRHSRPFSWSDFSFGSGGTLPMQALVARPAMKTWHVAQSPLLVNFCVRDCSSFIV